MNHKVNVDTARLCKRYVDRVSQIPEVRVVVLSQGDNAPRILTIVDTAPFERAVRGRVYEAQQYVLLSTKSPLVEFRLINVSEVEEDLDKVVPPASTILYSARTASHAQ